MREDRGKDNPLTLIERIRHANEEELIRLLEAESELQSVHIQMILNHPYSSQRVVEKLLEHSEWISHYRVKVALVQCARTPFHVAMHYIYDLFWRDLVQVSLNYRIDPRLRLSAERLILQKLEEMAVGEKMALAKIASRRIITFLRQHETDYRVLIQLLKNPRLVEEDIIVLLSRPELHPAFIQELVRKPFWAMRQQVRRSILKHSKTPLTVAQKILSRLSPQEIRLLANDPSIRAPIRFAIQKKLRR